MALAASGVLFLTGSRLVGAALAGLALLPVAAFSLYLTSIGLDTLPNSVVAKLSDGPGSGADNLIVRLSGKLAGNIYRPGGTFLFGIMVATALVALLIRRTHYQRALFGIAMALVGLAHLTFGAIGWMDRYENYALISVSAALVLLLSGVGRVAGVVVTVAIILGGVVTYSPKSYLSYGWNMSVMQLQQREMGRLAKEFVRAPVAVNDLGHVSWQNPNYVLDLWGLASREALEIRLSDPEQGWAGPLVDANDVGLIMVYDRVLHKAVSDNWVRVGTLFTEVERAFTGGFEVAFYASSAEASEHLEPLIKDWASGLPERAYFRFSEKSE